MTEHFNWLWVAAPALVGGLAAGWAYLRSAWQQLLSYVIVTVELNDFTITQAVTHYCFTNAARSPYGRKAYQAWHAYIQPLARVALVAGEDVSGHGCLFWFGRKPLWLKNLKSGDSPATAGSGQTNTISTFSFIRGTFRADAFIDAAVEYDNCTRQATTERRASRRHRVHYVFGTANKPVNKETSNITTTDCVYNEYHVGKRVLRWSLNDIGHHKTAGTSSLGMLALPAHARTLVHDIQRWLASEQWHQQRGIPWRRSARIVGPPGTGKTALVRAISEDLDLPIYVYDLSTLFNDELHREWQLMLSNVPCIALIEDIDGVFDGRKNISAGPLTFDALLNTMDGVDRDNGLFVVITTNNPAGLDPALTRPGRSDCEVRLGPLEVAGRRQLVGRILQGWPHVHDKIVHQGVGMTGAEFERLCSDTARELFWGEPTTLPIDRAAAAPLGSLSTAAKNH